MTATNKSTMKTEAIYSEDGKYRYLLRKEWDRNKARSMIIMKSPSDAGELIFDHTTMHVINNLVRLEFGSVDILNLYPRVNATSMKDLGRDEEALQANDEQIVKAAQKAEVLIYAWGSGVESSKKVKKRIDDVKALLAGCKGQVMQIAASNGRSGFHPLAAEVRSNWILK